jgi:hypothetical protein
MCVHGPAIIRARRNRVKRVRPPHGYAVAIRVTRMAMQRDEPGRRSNHAAQCSPGITFGGIANTPRASSLSPRRRTAAGRHASARNSALPGNAPSTAARGDETNARDPGDHHEPGSQQIARDDMGETIDGGHRPEQSASNEDPSARHPVSLRVAPLRAWVPRALVAAGDPRCGATISDSPAPKRPESTIRFRLAPRSRSEPHKTPLLPESEQPGRCPGCRSRDGARPYGFPWSCTCE